MMSYGQCFCWMPNPTRTHFFVVFIYSRPSPESFCDFFGAAKIHYDGRFINRSNLPYWPDDLFFTSFVVLAENKKKKNIPEQRTLHWFKFTRCPQEIGNFAEMFAQLKSVVSSKTGFRLSNDRFWCLLSQIRHEFTSVQKYKIDIVFSRVASQSHEYSWKIAVKRVLKVWKNKLRDIIYVRCLCNEENRCKAKIMISK